VKVNVGSSKTKLPGYKKYYLTFDAKTGKSAFEVQVAKALHTKTPVYLGGDEPKFSLFLGEQPIIETPIIEKVVKDNKAAAIGGLLSFHQRLALDDPAYKYSCRCGVICKTKKMYFGHQARCSVLHYYRDLFKRIEESFLVKEFGDVGKRKKKRKTKRPKIRLSAKEREQIRRQKTKRVKKAVSKRRTRTK
jgi:hypothetical protein